MWRKWCLAPAWRAGHSLSSFAGSVRVWRGIETVVGVECFVYLLPGLSSGLFVSMCRNAFCCPVAACCDWDATRLCAVQFVSLQHPMCYCFRDCDHHWRLQQRLLMYCAADVSAAVLAARTTVLMPEMDPASLSQVRGPWLEGLPTLPKWSTPSKAFKFKLQVVVED